MGFQHGECGMSYPCFISHIILGGAFIFAPVSFVFCISAHSTSLIYSYKLLQYYTESATGYIFRSLRDVIRYLETGDVGIHVSKPKKMCTSAKDSTDNKLSVSLTCMLHYPSYFHVHLTYISSLSILIALHFFFLKHYNVLLPKDPAFSYIDGNSQETCTKDC